MSIADGAPARALSIHCAAIPVVLGHAVLEPVRLQGHEGLNGLFEYELWLEPPDASTSGASGAANLDLDSFVGHEIGCRIELDGAGRFVSGTTGAATDRSGAGVRQINALITEASSGEVDGRHVCYRLTLRPWLYLATHRSDCRIFQDRTVVEILEEVLAAYAFTVDKRLIETYPSRDYQTQYNENDFEFFSRLCQEWGISYFFEHGHDRHRLVLIDNLGAYQENLSAAYRVVDYHPPGWKLDAEYIHRFESRHRLTSGRYTTGDHDYTRPRADLGASRSEPRPTGHADGEVYQWHDARAGSHYAQPRASGALPNDPREEGRRMALLRMQALRTDGERATGGGNLRGMVPGCSFVLRNHPRERANDEYLILETRLLLEDIARSSRSEGVTPSPLTGWKVEVDFTAHPVREPLRPALTQPKPLIHGPQTARVVGPEDQNIWTDEFGRVKVQFFWDRIGHRNQHSSCWIRANGPWAGNQTGAMFVPRIGQELVIGFEGGDPDLPICLGHVHNQNNLPPWKLPGQAALSGFRSRELTLQGGNAAPGRSNQLVMDDTAGQMQAQLRSDHRHSQLGLGYFTRVEDHTGRRDARGEGFELRSDGPGVARAAEGMLITTEARRGAIGRAMDMEETLDRLSAGHDLQAQLAESARRSGEQVASDRHDVVGDIAAQNDDLRGPRTPDSNDQGHGPIAPHLVLASPAGIETSTAGTTHIASARHTALTSGGHTRIAAARSFFVSVKESIRLYARDAVIRLVAARQDIDIVALERNIAILAKLDIRMTADRISIRAAQRLELGGGTSYTSYTSAGITHMTPGAIVEHAGSRGLQGPMSVDQAHPLPSGSGPHDSPDVIEEHFVLFEHAGGLRLPRQKYRIVFDGGRTVEGTTNDDGETEVVRSMVAQIATVDLLRHAEDGVLARHTPYVRMPAAQRHEREDGGGEAVAAEKRERRIGGTAHPANADQATSVGKAPVHTSCDPNNWGLRKSEPRAGDATRWDYPVAEHFVKAIKPQLMAIDWKKATWPLGDADFDVLSDAITTTVQGTLSKTAFKLPVTAMPRTLIPRDKEARELGMDPDDENLKGVMRLNDWRLVACKGGVTSMINVANKGTADELGDCVRDFASTLFHEARHAQQFFWAAAMAQQFPQDYPTLPHLARYWRENLPPAIAQLAATTPVPDEPSARAGIHRMVIGMYYWQLTFVAQANQRRPHEPGYLSNILTTELASARKAAHDLLQHVGLGGQSIDVDAMARGPGGSSGYRMRPWEEDSFVCDELVKRLWRGAADSLLPEPGFCTAALTHALAVRDDVTPGDTRRED